MAEPEAGLLGLDLKLDELLDILVTDEFQRTYNEGEMSSEVGRQNVGEKMTTYHHKMRRALLSTIEEVQRQQREGSI